MDNEDTPTEIDNELTDIWIAITERDDSGFHHHMRRLLELNRKLMREEEQQ